MTATLTTGTGSCGRSHANTPSVTNAAGLPVPADPDRDDQGTDDEPSGEPDVAAGEPHPTVDIEALTVDAS